MASHASSRSVSSGSIATRHSTPADLSLAEKAKEGLITAACEERDLAALVDLATSTHGLLSDSLRRTAWPLLLGCSGTDVKTASWKDLPAHREEGQVGLDVNRAFVYYPKYGEHRVHGSDIPQVANEPQTPRRSLIAGNTSSPMSS